jgi:hypothetical protein
METHKATEIFVLGKYVIIYIVRLGVSLTKNYFVLYIYGIHLAPILMIFNPMVKLNAKIKTFFVHILIFPFFVRKTFRFRKIKKKILMRMSWINIEILCFCLPLNARHMKLCLPSLHELLSLRKHENNSMCKYLIMIQFLKCFFHSYSLFIFNLNVCECDCGWIDLNVMGSVAYSTDYLDIDKYLGINIATTFNIGWKFVF